MQRVAQSAETGPEKALGWIIQLVQVRQDGEIGRGIALVVDGRDGRRAGECDSGPTEGNGSFEAAPSRISSGIQQFSDPCQTETRRIGRLRHQSAGDGGADSDAQTATGFKDRDGNGRQADCI